MKKSRAYAFTYYPTDVERDHRWFRDLSVHKQTQFMVMGLELCPTTKKKHFQGFIRWKNAKTLKAAKRWFSLDKIHLETPLSCDQFNKEYCLAIGKYQGKPGYIKQLIDVGEPVKQGKRTDIEEAIHILKETSQMREVLETVPNYQAARHAELYLKYKEKPRVVEPIEVIWIYGASGTGKTRYVYDRHPDVFRPTTFKWWEGYDGHEVVLIDDFRKSYCNFDQLLRLLDIYPFRVETKGGSRQVNFKKIYITTPLSPEQTFYHTDEELNQLQRRITHTVELTK